ncbi:PHD finger protein 3 [Camellia lanceoleosa]|uniref:PHD finger protein 3 n=1 Tax=Camellia lanceoleosa TaxID=1840588 RepID=A0ACC0FWY0_9ERIC|nr:PHD finger protein 3 [Camellia lanceoleosa]
MSGEIPLERLYSMTTEELASKELSQWRMTKAKELAQMVVLPDSDVDIRHLVRKTHKGEFQVEVEQDDCVSEEISIRASSLIRVESRNTDTEACPSVKADEIQDKENVVGEKSNSENQGLSCSLTIPNDGTNLMQSLIVDEFKDADFLLPIVFLDKFMESLDSEPLFENLLMDSGKTISPSDKESSKSSYEVTSSDLGSQDPVDSTLEKSNKLDVKTKTRKSPIEPKSFPPDLASKGGEYV